MALSRERMTTPALCVSPGVLSGKRVSHLWSCTTRNEAVPSVWARAKSVTSKSFSVGASELTNSCPKMQIVAPWPATTLLAIWLPAATPYLRAEGSPAHVAVVSLHVSSSSP